LRRKRKLENANSFVSRILFGKGEDTKALPLVGLVLALAVSLAAAPGESSWRMKADYVEACSCHLFCPCYFNKHAEHPKCEFNMAVTVREGHSGNVDLANTKYWLTGHLGDKWGTEKKATWVTVSFDPKTTQAQRDALKPIIQVMARLPATFNIDFVCSNSDFLEARRIRC